MAGVIVSPIFLYVVVWNLLSSYGKNINTPQT